ncbi:MAG: TlpA disulfide reductase family protein [Armatimonadetes bacterium]|nr:TlpA disulfide reductase family protein [Armatimonadota bacterium]
MNSRIRPILAVCALAAALAISGCSGKDAAVKSPAQSAKPAPNAKPANSKPSVSGGQSALPSSPLTDALAGKTPANPLDFSGNSSAKPGYGNLPTIPKPGIANSVKPIPPVGRPEPKQLLMVVQAAYRSAKTLRIDGFSSSIIKQDGKVVMREQNVRIGTLYKAPSKFVLSSPDFKMTCDGKNVAVYAAAAKRYQKMPFNAKFARDLVYSKPGIGVMGLLFGVDYISAIDSFKLLKDAKMQGQDTFVLALHFKKGAGGMPDSNVNQTLWIGKRDLVVYKNQVIVTMHPKAPKGFKGKVPKLIETTLIGTVQKCSANTKIADSVFVFKAPSGAKAITAPKPVDLIGKPAPELSFTSADGSKKSISDFKGKPVILIFWALPMPDEQLSALQSAYDKQKDNAEIIAINFNGQNDKVKEFMQKKDYSLPIVFGDESMFKLAVEKYGMRGMPFMLIIDKAGNVRLATIGIPDANDMAAKVEKYGL